MNASTKQRGRPSGGKNLVHVPLSFLKEVLNDLAKIPVSVKFAKSIGFAEENSNAEQKQDKQANQPTPPPVAFTVSEDF